MSAHLRFKFIDQLKDSYNIKSLCKTLSVSRFGYYKFKANQGKPHKYAELLVSIQAVLQEDEFNDNYGRERFKIALDHKGIHVSERTIYRVLKEFGLGTTKKRRINLTQADKEAHKSDDLLQGDFGSNLPGTKILSDMTQLPTKDGVLYISAVFDACGAKCIGLSMDKHMETSLVIKSLMGAKSLIKPHAIFHTDRGSQYTSKAFRRQMKQLKITQSMSHAKTNCYGNARCESFFARFKEEAIYNRYNTREMSIDQVKSLVFRYFYGYWNNRRIFGKRKTRKSSGKIRKYLRMA